MTSNSYSGKARHVNLTEESDNNVPVAINSLNNCQNSTVATLSFSSSSILHPGKHIPLKRKYGFAIITAYDNDCTYLFVFDLMKA